MNLFPGFDPFLTREDKQSLLKQKGLAIWMSGLSGSGKSTIANAAERLLHQEGKYTVILDGDNVRSGLNSDLGFSDSDRLENIRRLAEIAKILVSNGAIVFISAITPHEELRKIAKSIIGADDLIEVYVKASFEACAKRDVKGLYAKAADGKIPNFTGKQSNFEVPTTSDLTLDTETLSIEAAAKALHQKITTP